MTLATLYFGMSVMDHLNINFGWERLWALRAKATTSETQIYDDLNNRQYRSEGYLNKVVSHHPHSR